jgi:hypothetical protein
MPSAPYRPDFGIEIILIACSVMLAFTACAWLLYRVSHGYDDDDLEDVEEDLEKQGTAGRDVENRQNTKNTQQDRSQGSNTINKNKKLEKDDGNASVAGSLMQERLYRWSSRATAAEREELERRKLERGDQLRRQAAKERKKARKIVLWSRLGLLGRKNVNPDEDSSDEEGGKPNKYGFGASYSSEDDEEDDEEQEERQPHIVMYNYTTNNNKNNNNGASTFARKREARLERQLKVFLSHSRNVDLKRYARPLQALGFSTIESLLLHLSELEDDNVLKEEVGFELPSEVVAFRAILAVGAVAFFCWRTISYLFGKFRD